MTEQSKFALPAPTVDVPPGYMMDAKGRLVPEAAVKPHELLEDQMVRKVLAFAADLSGQIARFKGHTFDDANAFMALAAEQYGVTKRGAKGRGNVTFTTYDGLMKFQIAVADRLTFGAELQIARELFEECIEAWSEGARPELRVLVDTAFQTDREGAVSRDAIFRLLRMEFEDQRWKDGQRAIRDSIRVIGSCSYCRFYVREHQQAQWRAITIDLAAA